MADEHIRQAASNGQLPAIPAEHADAAQPAGENPFRKPSAAPSGGSAWPVLYAIMAIVLTVIVAMGMIGKQSSTTFSTICICMDSIPSPPAPPEGYIP